ncbi:tail tape measure protein [Qipengyuania sp. GH1]|uniref:tail tape measure protein n=1 Tax=Qipengyuania aestuarii TaxID=2867241 RepID=UPI001C86CEE9|nr:tail tape measure protein [Qipengyuania aestuarii]MBX7536425.1 tail tape measure protein [Qipengyuania aestuarii]
MEDDYDDLLVAVRADTRGFAQDIAAMRRDFDTTLVSGFEMAGKLLETSLTGALRNGKLEFEDLKRVALSALDQIAARALNAGLDSIMGGGNPAGGMGGGAGGGLAQMAGLFSQLIGSFLGLPGRATGGLVGPDRPYLVGERGPEVFVPTSAGHIEPSHKLGGPPREVRVAINIATPPGTSAPVALQRSSRQVASALRRVLVI